MYYKNIEEPKKLVFCHFCERDITGCTYISCQNCELIELCLICFANGLESEKHKRSHEYKIFSDIKFQIFDKKWSAHEELKFLEGLKSFGYGNWEDISQFLGTKDPADSEKHFYFCYQPYLQQKEILQIQNRQKIIEKEIKEKEEGFQLLTKQKINLLQKDIIDAEKFASEKNYDPEKNTVFGEILGYMPLRREFDVEYDNEAELLLAEMEFTENESEEDKKIKYSILEIYNKRLKERKKRKDFVIDRDLLNLKKTIEFEKTITKKEREVRNHLKPFARFLSKEEYEELVKIMMEEIKIKDLIKELTVLKLNGVKNIGELEKVVLNELDQKKSNSNILQTLNHTEKQSKRKTNNYTNKLKLQNICAFHDQQQSPLITHDLDYCQEELKLCEDLKLTTDQYICVKEYLVRECIHNGFIDREDFLTKYKIENKETVNRIIDLNIKHNVLLEKKQIIQFNKLNKIKTNKKDFFCLIKICKFKKYKSQIKIIIEEQWD